MAQSALSFEDQLAVLEADILKYFLARGYKLAKDQTEDDVKWSFKVDIKLRLKKKYLAVELWATKGGSKVVYEKESATTSAMWSDALKYFERKE